MMNEINPLDTHELEAAKEALEKEVASAALLEVDDLKWLMSNKRGRRVVARLLERAGVWRSSFNTNALLMSFSEGQRNEGLRLLEMITTHCPDRFVELLKESK